MAKTKKTATHSWTVVSNGQSLVIEAGHVEVADGALILTDNKGGHLLRAFAHGAWSSVEAVPPTQH
jgi:hypothetical protein